MDETYKSEIKTVEQHFPVVLNKFSKPVAVVYTVKYTYGIEWFTYMLKGLNSTPKKGKEKRFKNTKIGN